MSFQSKIDYQMAMIRGNIAHETDKKVNDIIRRIDKGIYGTKSDITLEELWEELNRAQEMMADQNFVTHLTALMDEIEKRRGGRR